jgi:general secretion pathway protein I
MRSVVTVTVNGARGAKIAGRIPLGVSLRHRRSSTATLRKWRFSCSRRRAVAGFTLVEVIVAIAILSLTLTILLNVIANSIRQTSQAEKMAEAGSLAESLVARLGTERPIREGLDAGQFANGFRWRLNVQSFGDAADRQQWPVAAYKVSVEIRWEDGGGERSFALTTLRLAPKVETR